MLQTVSTVCLYFVKNWSYIYFFCNLCVCCMICPSVSCCFSHTFHLLCCYSSWFSCFNGPIPYRITELRKLAYLIILLLFSLNFPVLYACYFQLVIPFLINVHLFFIRYQTSLVVEGIYLFYNFIIYYTFASIWTSSFKCINPAKS